MKTYEIPDEPESGPLWGPTPDGEGWIEYWKSTATGLWYDAAASTGGRMTWYELLGSGPLLDDDPRITLEMLAQRVVDAALRWRKTNQEAPGPRYTIGARDDLNRAVDAYQVKLERSR